LGPRPKGEDNRRRRGEEGRDREEADHDVEEKRGRPGRQGQQRMRQGTIADNSIP